jgi:uncharacterized protein (TIGR03067 family)
MRFIVVLMYACLTVSAAGFPLDAYSQGADHEKEMGKFQGAWVMVSGEHDGKQLADDHISRSKITYEGSKGTLVVPQQHHETIIFDIVKLDPAANPKQFHFIRRNGPNAGKTVIGIYEFDGDDLYQFAFDPTGTATLKEFSIKEGTGHIRHSWKRAKP